ncbi:hypothetical protein RN01_05150 [Cupriavidus sp. SHE]|uniref:hypothetical protein n=1 Tax=Cupriavidus TaxID=106589 RepID=UPI0005657DC3|nr:MULTISPECIES: hypothetical protein [Cupriavidus]KWR85412.1 hypothetical protein RN01_05150 [Cupriavidus sp. SHE]GMG94631.1 hypothetical protein Cmtc_58510 [Cupriavidus sp. TKC]
MFSERVYIFEKIVSGVPANEYIEGFVQARYPDLSREERQQITADALDTYRALAATPFLLSTDNDLKAVLPHEKLAELRLHQSELRKQMRHRFFLPPTERIIRDEVSVLVQDGGALAAGTVVYRRETSHAVMLCALPYSILDIKTGRFSHALSLRPAHESQQMEHYTWLLAFAASNSTATVVSGAAPQVAAEVAAEIAVSVAPKLPPLAVELIDDGLTIASVLVWALPMPYGPIGAGVATLAQILFGAFGHDNGSPVIDAIKNAVETLQNFIDQKIIEDKQGDLIVFQEWISRQAFILNSIQENSAPYIEDRILPTLNSMLGLVGGTLPKAINTFDSMFCKFEVKTVEDYKYKISLYHLWMAAVSLYLMALRMRFVYGLKIADHYSEMRNEEKESRYTALWLGDYAEFIAVIHGDQGTLKGWPERVAAHLPALRRMRDDFVTLERMPEEGYYKVNPGTHDGSVSWIRETPAGWGLCRQGHRCLAKSWRGRGSDRLLQ